MSAPRSLRLSPSGSRQPYASDLVDVTWFGAGSDGDPSSAFARAAAFAVVNGGAVYVPAGTYGDGTDWTFALPSGIELVGDGAVSVLRNCHVTATGTVGEEIALTAPAAKGATSISLPASGLSGAWLHIASCINANSADAGTEQLGDRAADFSYLAEFKRVNVGSVGSATLYGRLLYPYSNTPGPDSGAATSSTARVVTWHEGGRIRALKFEGINSTKSCAILGMWCRDLQVLDVTVDSANVALKGAIQLEYCIDSLLRDGSYSGRNAAAAAAENVVIFRSCQRVRGDSLSLVGGYQGGDITYVVGSPFRGGPSIDCGFVDCTSTAATLEGFCDHPGCHRSTFSRLVVTDANNGVRVRSRGARVEGCNCSGGAGSGVLIQEAALFDCDVSGNHVDGYLFGIEFTGSHASGYNALRALLAGSQARIRSNTVQNTASNGIALIASSALSTYVGPRVVDNDVSSPGAHGVSVGSYQNGAVVERNRIYNVPAARKGVDWQANIKRLRVGTNDVFGVNATGFAIGGPSVATFITDLVTFPGGESDAQLYLGDIFTDAATPFSGIVRASAAYIQAMWAGNGGGTYQAARIFFGAGSPEGVVYAVVGSLYLRSNGAAGTTQYTKESGVGNTGWVPK